MRTRVFFAILALSMIAAWGVYVHGQGGTANGNNYPVGLPGGYVVLSTVSQATLTGAINALPNGGTILLPAGTFNIPAPGLNLTNISSSSTPNTYIFEGAGAFASTPGDSAKLGTVLQFNYTGAGTVGVDISGSTNLHFKNIVFSCGTSAGSNAPTVCFLHGRTLGSNGIQDKLEDCFVVGYSPWIYYNFHGEQFTSIDTAYAEYGTSGVPVTLSIANTAGITSPFVTFGGSSSMSIVYFAGSKNFVSSQSTTVTAPNNSLIYLDEGTGIIQSPFFKGYANETVGTSLVLVQDTAGASGAIENADFNFQVDSNAASNNVYFNVAGTARYWRLDGKINPFNNTGGPALNFTTALIQSIVKINTNVTASLTSPNCANTIYMGDPGSTVTCTTVPGLWMGVNGIGGIAVPQITALGHIVSSGNGVSKTGTGACATFAAPLGGRFDGSFTCTGTSGAATITITPNVSALNRWVCTAQDLTTPADSILPTVSGTPTTTCTFSAAAIVSGDLIQYELSAH